MSIGIKCAPGVVGPAEADIDFDIIKNDNDTFTVKYTPPGAGLYTIMVLFANQVWGQGAAPLHPRAGHMPRLAPGDSRLHGCGCAKLSGRPWVGRR